MTALKLCVSIGICLLAGFIGSIFTTPSIATWYETLNKPALNPPNWVFAPVWTTLFILMGISLFLIWQKGLKSKGVVFAIVLFVIQLLLNMKWSFLFFGMHSPLYAFVDIVVLWLMILWAIIAFSKISKLAGWLLLPYLLWVSFASYLNFMVYLLNR